MRKIILLLFLFILILSKKYLGPEILSEEFDDDIVLQKAGFGGIHQSISIPKPVGPKPSVPKSNPVIVNPTPAIKESKPFSIIPFKVIPNTTKPKPKPKPIRVNTTPIKVKLTTVKFKPTITKNPGVKLGPKVIKNQGKISDPTKISKPASIFKGRFPVSNPLNNKNEIKMVKIGKVSIKNDYHNVNVDGSVTRTNKLAGSNVKNGIVTTHKEGKTKGNIFTNFLKGKDLKKNVVNNSPKSSSSSIKPGANTPKKNVYTYSNVIKGTNGVSKKKKILMLLLKKEKLM